MSSTQSPVIILETNTVELRSLINFIQGDVVINNVQRYLRNYDIWVFKENITSILTVYQAIYFHLTNSVAIIL